MRLKLYNSSIDTNQIEASIMPSAVQVPSPPVLQREVSRVVPPMTTVPSCPVQVLPPAQAGAPVPSAPCPTAKTMESCTGSEPMQPKQPKRARATKASDKTADAVAAAPTTEMSDDVKTPESGSWLIVAKAVRMHLKSHETAMHCGSDALPALNAKLADIIRDAIVRAQNNGRKTLKACDF